MKQSTIQQTNCWWVTRFITHLSLSAGGMRETEREKPLDVSEAERSIRKIKSVYLTVWRGRVLKVLITSDLSIGVEVIWSIQSLQYNERESPSSYKLDHHVTCSLAASTAEPSKSEPTSHTLYHHVSRIILLSLLQMRYTKIVLVLGIPINSFWK